MEHIRIREPEQIRQDCATKVVAVIRGIKLRAVLGYFVGEIWATPAIADVRLASDGRLVARLRGEIDFRVYLGDRNGLIRALRSIGRKASLDGDESGYLLAQVAAIKREE